MPTLATWVALGLRLQGRAASGVGADARHVEQCSCERDAEDTTASFIQMAEILPAGGECAVAPHPKISIGGQPGGVQVAGCSESGRAADGRLLEPMATLTLGTGAVMGCPLRSLVMM
jgi:hypothetical protein